MTESSTLPTATTRPRSLVRRALASNLVDRLTAPHGVDRYLELIDRSWTVHPGSDHTEESGGVARRKTAVIPDAPAAPATASTGTVSAEPGTSERTADTGVVITFARSEVTAAVEGTLLTTAESAGLMPRNRCRRGICGTCTTRKVAGSTRNTVTGEISDEPGPIRICVTEACGDDVTLDL